MTKILRLATIATLLLVICSCGGPKLITKEAAFPKMYEEQPRSILVLPPINESTAADAKEYYSTTLAEPLSINGYYVFPMEVTTELLKKEGFYDTELILNTSPQKFGEYFGADAVLYPKIVKWDTSYYVVGGHVSVGLDFLLKSTKSGATLWKYNHTIVLDTTGENVSSGNPLVDLVGQLVLTAVKTASADYLPLARQANFMTINTMPTGRYNQSFNADRAVQIVDLSKEENK